MDIFIPYTDPTQAAVSRSAALRWLMAEGVVSEDGVARQFHLSRESVMAIQDGAPILVAEERAHQVDRLVAAQSVLLEGYSPGAMAGWFLTAMPTLKGRRPADLLAGEDDASAEVLKVASAWMA